MKRKAFADVDGQVGFAGMGAGLDVAVDLFHRIGLTPALQGVAEGREVERVAAFRPEAPFVEAVGQPAVAFHPHGGEPPLDDAEGRHAVRPGPGLEARAGIHVAAVDVVSGHRHPGLLQVEQGERAVRESAHHRVQFRDRERAGLEELETPHQEGFRGGRVRGVRPRCPKPEGQSGEEAEWKTSGGGIPATALPVGTHRRGPRTLRGREGFVNERGARRGTRVRG